MLNIISLSIRIRWLGHNLNKGISHRNFIFLVSLLCVWLLFNTMVIQEGPTILYYLLSIIIILSMKTKSLLLFYIFFEMRVIPITIVVFFYGYQPEKLQASFALLIYTVVSSLPLLLFILYLPFNFISGSLLTVPITLVFMVKSPIYLLHMWLPKAHVEAPVGGSMFLAGILLKLGSYGLLLFLPIVKLNQLLCIYFSLSLLGSLISAMVCLRQGDIKVLIAYSSVVHMGVVNLGFLRGTEIGYTCGLIMILAHGLCSPLLFSFAFWLYQISHSRQLLNNSFLAPSLGAAILLLVLINMSVPPRLSLWSELFMCVRVIFIMWWTIPLLLVVLFAGAVYNLYFYTACFFTKKYTLSEIRTVNYYPVIQRAFLCYTSFLCLEIFHL